MTCIEEISGDGIIQDGRFPLRFGRQAGTSPPGVRIGLVKADMTNRLCGMERTNTCESIRTPPALRLLPLKRSFPPLRLTVRPAIREPQTRRLVSIVGHKAEILFHGDGSRRETKGIQKYLMSGCFVVECEPISIMPDPADASRK